MTQQNDPLFYGYNRSIGRLLDQDEWYIADDSSYDYGIDWGGAHTEIEINDYNGNSIDELRIGDSLDENGIFHIYTPGTNPHPQGQCLPTPHTHIIGVAHDTSSTVVSLNTGNEKYAVMGLPRKDEVPTAVFVCGRMLTLGALGTDVECAYAGDQLVFEPGVVTAMSFGGRITISIEFHDEICHYNAGQDGVVTYDGENSSTLETTLVSTIKKKKGDQITRAK